MNNYIVLKSNGNREYQYVQEKNINTITSNVIDIEEITFYNILSGKNVNIRGKVDNLKNEIVLSINKKFIKNLFNVFKEKHPDFDEEALNILLENTMQNSLKKLSKINVDYQNGFVNIDLCFDKKMVINDNENSSNSSIALTNTITSIDMSKFNPSDVVNKIKEKVIAQDKTVETVLYNIYNNQKIIESGNKDLLSSKANIILDGPTGTGKTFILKEVSKNLEIPMNIIPADIFAAPGYKGAQLEEMLIPLLDKTGGNVELAERGIVVLDEFDKLCVKGDKSLEMHKAIQYNLLTYIGGTTISFDYKGKKVDFDTSKLTFICLGAFTDLRERKIREELDGNGNYSITPEDYIEEGMVRELVGRFSLATSTKAMTKDDFIKVLKESKTSPLLNLEKIAMIHGKEIIYDDLLIEKIAEEAVKMNTGARALQTIVNGIENQFLGKLIDPKGEKEIIISESYLDEYKKGFIRRAV